MRRRSMAVLALGLALAAGVGLDAQELPKVAATIPDRPGMVVLSGREAEPGLFCVQLAVSQFKNIEQHPEWAIRGIQVFSEPSHTLLAAYTESGFEDRLDAKARGTGPMGGTLPLLCTRETLPEGDNQVSLTVLTGAGPRPVGVVAAGIPSFHVAVTLPPEPNMPPLEICCVCGSCKHCDYWRPHCVCICPDCVLHCTE